MTPRAAGVLLMIASVLAGVVAGWWISSPAWGIPAAVLLTVATVGMLAGLLWLFRRSWDDKTWPPGPTSSQRPWSVRARRSALTFGIVLLAFVPPLIAAAIWMVLDGTSALRLIQPTAYVILYTVIGVGLIRIGRKTTVTPTPGERPADEGLNAGDGTDPTWQRIGRRDWSLIVLVATPFWLLLIVVFPLRLPAAWASGGLWLIIIALSAVGVALTLLVVARRTPDVWIDVTHRRVRAGRRIARWDELTSAELMVLTTWVGAPRTLILTLRGPDGLRVPLVLRRRERLALSEAATRSAALLIEGSSIEMPRAKEDPAGKFSRFNFPSNVSKEEALAMVNDPPGHDDPLPIAVG